MAIKFRGSCADHWAAIGQLVITFAFKIWIYANGIFSKFDTIKRFNQSEILNIIIVVPIGVGDWGVAACPYSDSIDRFIGIAGLITPYNIIKHSSIMLINIMIHNPATHRVLSGYNIIYNGIIKCFYKTSMTSTVFIYRI